MKLVQSWDDGVADDARLCKLLRKYDARAAFNLNINLYQEERCFGWMHGQKEVWRIGRNELQEVYEGFEIASHSMNHPMLTDCDDSTLQWELTESRKQLQDIFQQPIHGFCYPFNVCDDRVKDAVRDAGYLYARGNKSAGAPFPPADPLWFEPHCHFLDLDFWSVYNRCRQEQCEVFFFWGHSYELIDENLWQSFESKIARLSEDPGNTWVAPSDLFT